MESDTNKAHQKNYQKKQIRWAVIIISFFFIGLAVDYFFIHFLFQEKWMNQQRQEQSQPLETPPAPSPDVSAPPTEGAQTPASEQTLKNFQTNIAQCLGDKELAASTSSTILIAKIQQTNPPVKTQFQLENTHIRLSDGSVRRLHLIQADSANSKDSRELRYFNLDKEGLPVRIALKAEETSNPKPEFIESLKKQGVPFYHQLKETRTLKDGTTVALNTVNNQVYEFQIFRKDKTLSCREFDCQCQ